MYHHFDAYPSGLGQALFLVYRERYPGSLTTMLGELIDEHPAGWSSIVNVDWTLPIGYVNPVPERGPSPMDDPEGFRTLVEGVFDRPRPPACYCHGERRERAHVVTEQNAGEMGVEYAYVLWAEGAVPWMEIWVSFCAPDGEHAGEKMVGAFGRGDPQSRWVRTGRIHLAGWEPDWEAVDAAVMTEPLAGERVPVLNAQPHPARMVGAEYE